jgi:SEC-C motif-containing protein
MDNVLNDRSCPCCSGLPYAECCGPLHAGLPAQTAAALMRSRYSAFVLKDVAYLLRSWDRRTRPAALDLSDDVQWIKLTILHAEGGSPDEDTGSVEFIARYRSALGEGEMREISRFRRKAGRWVYCGAQPGNTRAPSRNTPCPCGSGKKYKRCCGA